MKTILLMGIIFFNLSCTASSSDYRKLMDPIKKIKLEEQKLGKPAAVFDGIVEPNFPDDDKNNETLEGVDSNRDGVRDDVEIWINRTAEDQYVRIQLKEYYQKLFKMHAILIDPNATDVDKSEYESQLREAATCLRRFLYPHENYYLNKGIEIYRQYSNQMMSLVFNTSSRSRLVSKANAYAYRNTRNIKTEDYSFCSKKIPQSYIEKVIKDYQEQHKR